MLAFLFIISSSIMFSASLAFTPGEGYISFPYFLKYSIAITWFAFAVLKDLIKNKGKIKKRSVQDIWIYTLPVFIMMLSIITAILFQHTLSGDYLSRAISNLFTMASILFCVYGSVELFGEKTITYSFMGLVLSTLINIVYTSYLYGVVNVFAALANIINIAVFAYEDGSIMANIGYSLEVSDATFAYGFYFLYFLLFIPRGKKKKLGIIISLLGMYVGLKRVEIGAILIAIIAFYSFEKKTQKLKMLQRFFFLTFIGVTFIYLFLIKYNTLIFSVFGGHRLNIYMQLKNMFSISPLYIGKGFGYVNKWLSTEGQTLWILSVSHCDSIRMYIELGFWGFLAWIAYYVYWLPNYFIKRNYSKGLKIVLCFTTYIIVTYLIDNTLMLFATQFCYVMIPLAELKGVVKHKGFKIHL